jgi:hypothetical protein
VYGLGPESCSEKEVKIKTTKHVVSAVKIVRARPKTSTREAKSRRRRRDRTKRVKQKRQEKGCFESKVNLM